MSSLKSVRLSTYPTPEGPKAKYVGFSIIEALDPATFEYFNAAGDNYAVPRIRQLGVYGETKNEIAYAMPAFVWGGYTDLEAYHIDELGTVTPLAFWEGYNENEFVFQLEKMGQVAIVGTKLDGAEAGVIVGDSPETGESRAATAAVVSLMTAAAFVVTLSAKKKATDKK